MKTLMKKARTRSTPVGKAEALMLITKMAINTDTTLMPNRREPMRNSRGVSSCFQRNTK
ncbi:hypothetical protein D3C84_1211670 [compost metagenome]